jgi:hypothetical protein
MTPTETPVRSRSKLSAYPELAAGLFVIIVIAAIRATVFIFQRWGSFPDFQKDYQGIWYFVRYNNGFVRRGFFGELLHATGVSSDTARVYAVYVGVTAVAVALVIVLAILVARLAPTSIAGLAVFSILVTSPLTINFMIRDFGRLDGVGIALGAIALAGVVIIRPGWRLIVGLVIAALSLALATATEEFLIAFLAPIVIAGALARIPAREGRRPWFPALLGLLTLIPAGIVLVLSFANPMTANSALIVVARTGPALYGGGFGSPAWSLTQTTEDSIAFVQSFPDHWRTVALFGALFAATAISVIILTRATKWMWLAVGYLAAVAIGTAILGVDVLRWWSLATLALSATLVASGRKSPAEPSTPTRLFLGVCVTICLLATVAGSMPRIGGGFAAWLEWLRVSFLS